METIDLEQPAPAPSPRKGWIAFLLSLYIPGLGHFYLGKPAVAVILFVAQIITVFVFGATRWLASFNGLVILLTLVLTYRIIAGSLAAVAASNKKEYIPKPYNRWYYTLGIAVCIEALVYILPLSSALGLLAFRNPTPNNAPTMQMQDYVIGDTKWYDNNEPAYGDMGVFNINGVAYVLRIIGLPGDKVEFRNSQLIINGRKCGLKKIAQKKLDGMFDVKVMEQTLPNGVKHQLYLPDFGTPDPSADTETFFVPADALFLCNDNHAVPIYFFGIRKREELFAKLVYCYWGYTWDRIGTQF